MDLLDDDDTYLIITKVFCEQFNLPFNKTAAEKGAMKESEVHKALKGKHFNSEDELEDAMVSLVKESYLKQLKWCIN